MTERNPSGDSLDHKDSYQFKEYNLMDDKLIEEEKEYEVKVYDEKVKK